MSRGCIPESALSPPKTTANKETRKEDVVCHGWLASQCALTLGPEMPSGLPSAHPSYPVSSGRGHPVGYDIWYGRANRSIRNQFVAQIH
eukprot:6683698-Prymnesium_polylepis.1